MHMRHGFMSPPCQRSRSNHTVSLGSPGIRRLSVSWHRFVSYKWMLVISHGDQGYV